MSGPTVHAYLLAGGPPDLTTRSPKPGACRGDHEAYLPERWRAGCHDGTALSGELRGQGYRSSLRTMQRLVAGWRAPNEPRRGRRPVGLPAAPPCPTATRPGTPGWPGRSATCAPPAAGVARISLGCPPRSSLLRVGPYGRRDDSRSGGIAPVGGASSRAEKDSTTK